MDWGNLESGLVGAIGGSLLGSIVSYFGAFWLQRRDSEERQRAAGRAVLAEIVKNHQSLTSTNGKPAGYSEQVWQSQLPLVAQLLTWSELRIVAEPYLIAAEPLFELDRANDLMKSTEGREMPIRLVLLSGVGQMREKSQEELIKARNGFAVAANLLRDKLLSPTERQAFGQLSAADPDEPIRGESV